MANKTSKTSAAAMRSTKTTGRYEPSGDVNRLIPLGGGEFAYILTLDGRTAHAKVGSDAFGAALAEFRTNPAIEARVERMVEDLEARFPGKGWASAWAASAASEAAA